MKINEFIISVIIASVILSIQFVQMGYAQTRTTNLPTVIGDLNNDGKVDIIDLGILLSSWGRTDRPPADINQDGRVDVIDLGVLLSNWGRGTTTTTSTTIPTTTTTITSLKCKEVITGFNNKEENRINLVFMGINFPDIDSLKNSLDIYVNSDDELYGQLFYYEPFKSNKNKFNLWYVDEIGFVENYSEGMTHWGSEANPEIDRLSKYCNVQNKQEVALINWSFKDNAWFGKGVKISHVRSGRSGAVFVHEFGHSFGILGDEDASRTITSVTPYYENYWENCDIVTDEIACPRWCSGSPVPVEVMENFVCTGSSQLSCMRIGTPCLWIGYEDPIYGQTGCVNRVKLCKNITSASQCNSAKNSYWRSSVCIWLNRQEYPAYSYFKSNCIPTSSGDFNIGTNCLKDTGCYQTCGHSNWFKSSRSSMMRIAGFPFGTINERALCIRIQNTTRSVGGICTTKFGLS